MTEGAYLQSCLLPESYVVSNTMILINFGRTTSHHNSSLLGFNRTHYFLPIHQLPFCRSLCFGPQIQNCTVVLEPALCRYLTRFGACQDWPCGTHCESSIQKMTPLWAHTKWHGCSACLNVHLSVMSKITN